MDKSRGDESEKNEKKKEEEEDDSIKPTLYLCLECCISSCIRGPWKAVVVGD